MRRISRYAFNLSAFPLFAQCENLIRKLCQILVCAAPVLPDNLFQASFRLAQPLECPAFLRFIIAVNSFLLAETGPQEFIFAQIVTLAVKRNGYGIAELVPYKLPERFAYGFFTMNNEYAPRRGTKRCQPAQKSALVRMSADPFQLDNFRFDLNLFTEYFYVFCPICQRAAVVPAA